MEMILLFIVLAIVVEALVEYVKTVVSMDKQAIILQLSALAVSILLCLLAGADVFNQLGINFSLPYVGCILTGVFASRGANYASDIIGRLRGAKQNSNT